MTVTTAAPPQLVRQQDPGWFRALVAWRAFTVLLVAALLGGSLIRRGLVLEGPARWIMIAALVLSLGGAALALRWTVARAHSGRLAGFGIDILTAVVAAFIAFNRMGLFTGLDAVGEAFNTSIGWLAIIIIGWLIQGVAPRAGNAEKDLKRVARWTMLAGLAVLLLSMGLIQGLVEFALRAFTVDVLPVLAIAVIAVAFVRILYGDSANWFFGTTQSQTETMDGLLFVAPNMLGFLAFFAGPLIASLVISFTNWDGLTDATFVGLQNYIDLLSDPLFLKSLRNIAVFGIVAIPLAVVPALMLAALLNVKLPGMKVFRAVYFLPAIAGVVGVTLIWKQLFNSTVGYINFMILRATEWTNSLLGTSFEAAQPQWISDTNIALIAVIILFVWQLIGFNTVLFLAGMQGIDKTLYEAADIDGAGPWKKFTKITVPTLRPTTLFVVATTTILGLQLFNEPFILQSPNPPAGPGNATLTPVVYLYQEAFQQFSIGYASAVAWALFILIFGATLLQFSRGGEDKGLSP